MRAWACAIVIAVAVAACGPTVYEQRTARIQALQLDLDAALERWRAEVSLRKFPTSAEASRDLASRYEDVYARWGLRADPLTQATFAYAAALAARVDRREILSEDANALLGKMRADLDRERPKLAARHPNNQAERDVAMLAWWNEYWTAQRQAFQAVGGNPVTCRTAPATVTGAAVACF
jgi:uncharacterized membrane-anchored protein YhcB (DUF1043 family)